MNIAVFIISMWFSMQFERSEIERNENGKHGAFKKRQYRQDYSKMAALRLIGAEWVRNQNDLWTFGVNNNYVCIHVDVDAMQFVQQCNIYYVATHKILRTSQYSTKHTHTR